MNLAVVLNDWRRGSVVEFFSAINSSYTFTVILVSVLEWNPA